MKSKEHAASVPVPGGTNGFFFLSFVELWQSDDGNDGTSHEYEILLRARRFSSQQTRIKLKRAIGRTTHSIDRDRICV